MAQAFTLPPPPHAPRRHASRAQLHTPSVVAQPEQSIPSMPTQIHRDSKPIQVSQPSTSKPIDVSSNADASSTTRQGRSFKRSLKAAFSRSAPSSPERTPVALPEFPSELATTVAFVKNKSSTSTKPAKKSKSSKTKDTEVRYHAESKNHRPVTYQTAVELNMLMGGGSAEYWLAQTRQTGEEEDAAGNGVEVGGFQDDNGQIWWDMQEKVEFTSLLPKDSQGAPVPHTDDMWVEFDSGLRRNSTSSSSAESTISYLSSELEEISGSLFYGYGPGEMEPSRPHFTTQHATEATVLFPVEIHGDEPMSSELAVARSIISQANRQMYNKSAVVLADGFEDHFLSYESNAKRINPQPATAQTVTMVKATKPKGGLLKNLWGSKQTVRD